MSALSQVETSACEAFGTKLSSPVVGGRKRPNATQRDDYDGDGSEVGFGALQGTQERAGLIDVGLGVPDISVDDLGFCRQRVADGVAHYRSPSLALISAKVTVGSSGWAR